MIIIPKGNLLKNVLGSIKKMDVNIITVCVSKKEFLIEARSSKGDNEAALRFTYPISNQDIEERAVTVSTMELLKSLSAIRAKDGISIEFQKKGLKIQIISKNNQKDICEFQVIKCADSNHYEQKELPYNQLYLDPIIIPSTNAGGIAKIKVSKESKDKDSKDAKIPIRGCTGYLSFETPTSNFSIGKPPPNKGNFYSVTEDGDVSLAERFYSLKTPISFLKCIHPIATIGGTGGTIRFYIPKDPGLALKIVTYFATDGEQNAVVTLLLS